jgi:hypothetical protein
MPSRVIYGRDFDAALDQGLAPEQFTYRFLVEGDSWMDRSAPTQASLPWSLANAVDAAGESALFINLSMFGDTMRRIGDCLNDEFWQWAHVGFSWKFDALLFSGGGNDFIDAARDPAAGQGILQPPPAINANAQDCFVPGAIATLVQDYLDPNFAKLYDTVRASPQGNLPIFLNSYDIPTARKAPAYPGGKAWLFEAYTRNAIPVTLWHEVTERIFNEVESAVQGWTLGRTGVYRVPTVGTLVPAVPGTNGSSNDWRNEIHPNSGGWAKLAKVWQAEMKKVLPSP